MSLEVYVFPPSPFSRALLFFLEDVQIRYKQKTINLRRGENKSAEFAAINPTLKTPAIREGEFCLGETTAILRYLAIKEEKYSYYPEDLEQRAQYDFWLEFVVQNVVPFSRELVWQRHLFPAVGRAVSADLEERAEQNLKRSLQMISEQLKKNNYICGDDVSLADFLLTPSIDWHKDAKFELGEFAGLEEWLSRMTSRSSWKTVEEVLQRFNGNK